jgi:hypothetical protein
VSAASTEKWHTLWQELYPVDWLLPDAETDGKSYLDVAYLQLRYLGQFLLGREYAPPMRKRQNLVFDMCELVDWSVRFADVKALIERDVIPFPRLEWLLNWSCQLVDPQRGLPFGDIRKLDYWQTSCDLMCKQLACPILYIMRNLFPELDCFIFSSERHTFVAAIERGTDVVRYMGDFSLYSLRRREQLKERAADFMLTEARRNCVMLFNGYLPFIVHHGFMDSYTIGSVFSRLDGP